MSLSIPYPSIQWRSVWDLCALNNAVLKGQERDEGRVNALASCTCVEGDWSSGSEKLPLISRSVPIMKCIR